MTHNHVDGFRFTEGYEDVAQITANIFTYVEAEPFGHIDVLACIDYQANGDGTFSTLGGWYGIAASDAARLVNERPAPEEVAAAIVGAEFAHAFATDPYEMETEDDAMLDAGALIDLASCHLLEHGAPDVFEPMRGETYADFLGRWRDAFARTMPDMVA